MVLRGRRSWRNYERSRPSRRGFTNRYGKNFPLPSLIFDIASVQLQRPFFHRRHLLAQFQDAVLPVALRIEERKGGREGGAGPARCQPAGLVNLAQGAQGI